MFAIFGNAGQRDDVDGNTVTGADLKDEE